MTGRHEMSTLATSYEIKSHVYGIRDMPWAVGRECTFLNSYKHGHINGTFLLHKSLGFRLHLYLRAPLFWRYTRVNTCLFVLRVGQHLER
jgi:hypothetical protein